VVPYTRGEEVSRRFEDVLTEVAGLAHQGVKEVTLLGQNVNAFQGVMADGTCADFPILLEYVAEVPGIERIRFTTSHPKEFTQRLIEAYRELPKVVSHLHLPVQSGSDRILAAMKRGYTSLEYKSIIRRLRQVRPELSISTDLIVGFPGESDADFDSTLRLVEEVGFDSSFCFIYSPRPGTPAAALVDDTPAATKLARLQQVQGLIDAHARALSDAMVGSRQTILVEGSSRRDPLDLQGRTENNRVVNFSAGPRPERLVGQLIDVKITQAYPHSLRGELDREPAVAIALER
jgi:tRNA-2-methylthio-N6-dimethylallyladenosine synthase